MSAITHSHTLSYTVEYNDEDQTWIDARDDFLATYPLGSSLSDGAILTKVSATDGGTDFTFTVSATYEGVELPDSQTVPKWNVQVRSDSVESEQEQYRGWKNEGGTLVACDIVAKNELPYDPPLKQTLYDRCFTITFNSHNPTTSTTEDLQGFINNASVTIPVLNRACAKWTLKVGLVCSGSKTENGTTTYDHEYKLMYRKDTWVTSLPNEGTVEKADPINPGSSASSEWRLIRDPHGMLQVVKTPLDANGAKQAPGDTKIYLDYYQFPEADLSALITAITP